MSDRAARRAAARWENRPLDIIFYEPSGRGGICHYTWELAEHLAEAGNRVAVWTTEAYELESYPRHFRVDHLFKRSRVASLIRFFARPRTRPAGSDVPNTAPFGATPPKPGLRRIRILLAHLRALGRLLLHRPDVVHFQWLADRERDLWLMRILRRMRIPVVFTAHDVLPLEKDSEAERAFRARLYQAPDAIIVHSEADRRSLAEHFGRASQNVIVVPHGAYEFGFGRIRPIEQKEARGRLEIPVVMKVVLFFGLIKRYKGLEYLVSAFNRLERQLADAMLLVVGEIYRGDPVAYRDYTDLVTELRSRKNVKAVIGYVPVDDIPMYFAAADVVALPYTQTSQSGVLLTAYGSGRPVVVTDTGSLGEIVREGATGLVVPPRDPEAIANALLAVLSDPTRARQMGERARQLGATVYSWPAVARQTMETYRLAAAGREHLLPHAREGQSTDHSWTGANRS